MVTASTFCAVWSGEASFAKYSRGIGALIRPSIAIRKQIATWAVARENWAKATPTRTLDPTMSYELRRKKWEKHIRVDTGRQAFREHDV